MFFTGLPRGLRVCLDSQSDIMSLFPVGCGYKQVCLSVRPSFALPVCLSVGMQVCGSRDGCPFLRNALRRSKLFCLGLCVGPVFTLLVYIGAKEFQSFVFRVLCL